jgi:catecholate siderophore receptor
MAITRISLLLLCLALPFVSSAQSGSALMSLSGRVVDTTQAPITGAQIMAVPEGAETGPTTISDEGGTFSLSLTPGQYVLKISKEGFADSEQTVALKAATKLKQDIQLHISQVRTSVTVRENYGYDVPVISSATGTPTSVREIPQTIYAVTGEQIQDQMLMSIGDVVRYIPGITAAQGENNRDQIIIRGQNSSADFFVNGMRDDVQYYRDLYNLDRVEALKGPNALMFGRGGGGGIINRVVKEAGFSPLRAFTLEGGSFNDVRFTGDLDQPFGEHFAGRLNGLYETSDSFRNYVGLTRFGIAPSFTFAPSAQTKFVAGYEHFEDHRTADRGVPSFNLLPVDVPIQTYFGNPDDSFVRADVNIGSVSFEHVSNSLTVRNNSLFANYDRKYQNFVPGAVTPDGLSDILTAYNNATDRTNIFNETDVIYSGTTGRVRHVLLSGVELGLQLTDNIRNTGYFNDKTLSVLVPLADPTIGTPVTWRQSATDANNHLNTKLAAPFVQDQITVNPHLQFIAGLRYDYFNLSYHDNRIGTDLTRADNLLSPRLGVIYSPLETVSLYGSYSVSYLPSSGDQFSSLTVITEQLKPEKFQNYEVGVKWAPSRYLSVSTAGYLLDRTNTRSTDPTDPTRIVQTGATRTLGYEIGAEGNVTRKWRVSGGYSYQNAYIRNATTAARAGAQVAQVPHNSFALWNNYQIVSRFGVGLGIVNRSDMFAAVDNTVVLPAYTRLDAAAFVSLTERMRLQINVENVLNKTYYVNADNNNNISPGFPVTIRAGLVARF